MKVKFKASGEIRNVLWQEYEIGVYVANYPENMRPDETFEQFGLDMTAKEFVQSLRDNENLEIMEDI